MPYDSISTLEYMRWKRWAYWIMGVFFPTADVYVLEMGIEESRAKGD